MRLFVALDVTEEIRTHIVRFIEGVRNFAPDVRWAAPESLHITLKFIGEKPEDSVSQIIQTLAPIRSTPIQLNFRGYGFFPTPCSARVFWVGIEPTPNLPNLAKNVEDSLAALNIPKEDHVFSPHLTLARGGKSAAPNRQLGDGPNQHFAKLQEKLAALPSPEFGTMTAHEFYLYQSCLSRDGARYTKIAQFALTPQN